MAGVIPDTRIARDPETGETYKVRGDMTFNEWIKSLTPEQKEALKYVDKSAGSGIIKVDNIHRYMANGLRTSPKHILSEEEVLSIKRDAETIGVPINILSFNTGRKTGFSDYSRTIHIRGDVLPDTNSNNNRDRLSQRAVLAHEYYGHYKSYPSKFNIGDWRDEFLASYRAAIDTPNLTNIERRMLMIDAYDRAREANVSVRYNKIARRVIYGYE